MSPAREQREAVEVFVGRVGGPKSHYPVEHRILICVELLDLMRINRVGNRCDSTVCCSVCRGGNKRRMGRPSRKRPRPLLPTNSPKHVVMKHPPNVPAMFAGTGLRSLLIASASNTDVMLCSNTSAGNRETTQASRRETEAPAVQHVWGAVSEGDIAHDGSGLRLEVDVDVDRFGVVWLLNPGSKGTPPDHGSKTRLARGTNSPENGSGEDTANETGAATKDAEIAPGGSSSVSKPPPMLTQLSAGHLEKNTPAVFSDGAAGDEEQALRDELSTLKGEFGDIPTTVFKRARSACNPAEVIGSGPFLNRSAAKLANIDAMAGLLMSSGHPRRSGLSGSGSSCSPRRTSSETLLADWRTEPARQRPAAASAGFNGGDGGVGRLACRTHDGREISRDEAHKVRVEERERVGPKEGDEAGTQDKPFPLLLFADLCGGPGGFSEYILRRRRQLGLSAKGWGISLREEHFKERDELYSGDAVGDDPCEKGGNREVCEEKQGGRAGLSEDPDDDDDRRVRYKDPCAWRLDRLAPWCDVSVTRGGDSVELVRDAESSVATAKASYVRGAGVRSMATANDAPPKEGSKAVVVDGVVSKARSSFVSTVADRERGNGPHPRGTSSGDGDCCQHDAASAQGPGTTSNTVDLDTGDPSPPVAPPSAASLAPACPAAAATDDAQPLLEMRIDYGADGTGNLADENNIREFVGAVLASTGGRRLDLVVSDGGFGAARNARDQERLVSPLVHCEVSLVGWPCVVGWVGTRNYCVSCRSCDSESQNVGGFYSSLVCECVFLLLQACISGCTPSSKGECRT